MASVPTFDPNPYANFDPSQWSDPYSPFQSGPIPFPSSYLGWPTDSMGNPIQPQAGSGIGQPSAAQIAGGPAPAAAAPASSPGTTLNSTPNYGASNPPPGGSMYGVDPNNPGVTYAQERAMTPQAQAQAFINQLPGPQFNGRGGVDSQAANSTNANLGRLAMMSGGGAAPAAAAPAPAPAANPSGLSSAQYLQLLAHPNPVQTPGATVPQSAQSYQPNNSVLQAFLQNWQPAQSGPGSGFAQGFSKALRGS